MEGGAIAGRGGRRPSAAPSHPVGRDAIPRTAARTPPGDGRPTAVSVDSTSSTRRPGVEGETRTGAARGGSHAEKRRGRAARMVAWSLGWFTRARLIVLGML